MEQQQKFANTKDLIAFLATTFPLCFSVKDEAKPLKIGIFHDLAHRLEDDERVSKRILRIALRHYTSSWRYLACVKTGAKRVDLDGVEGDKIEAEHAQHAAEQLQESKQKAAEQRAAMKVKSAPKTKTGDKKNAQNKNKPSSKPTRKTVAQKEKLAVREMHDDEIVKGLKVSVKVGKTPMPAVVVDVAKDGIQVQLNSGMSVKVQAEQLRMII